MTTITFFLRQFYRTWWLKLFRSFYLAAFYQLFYNSLPVLVALEANLESDLICIEIWVFIKGGIRFIFKHAGIPSWLGFWGPVIIELLYLILNRLTCLRLHEASVGLTQACVPLLPSFSLQFFVVHVVGVDQFPLKVDLEATREVGGSRCGRIILVAEIVPLLPLVHEDSKVGWVVVQL